MPENSQSWILKPLALLGYPIDPESENEGICKGFAMMATQAMAIGRFAEFEQRVNFIKNQKSPEDLVYQINKAKHGQQGENAELYADTRAFFDSLYVAQQSQKERALLRIGF